MTSINQLTRHWAESKNISVHYTPLTDSTNTWAKKEFQEDVAIYLADHQTQGRGRNKNTWTDAGAGQTLLSTWCLRASSPPQPIFTLRVGLCLFEALQSAFPTQQFSLKAPNDIYLWSKNSQSTGKLAGILTEVEQRGSEYKIFIGVGMNVYGKPGSVNQETMCLEAFHQDDWFKFCFLLWQSFISLQKDSQRQRLTPDEQTRLLDALEKYPDNTITQLNADGSLILKNGDTLHWQDL